MTWQCVAPGLILLVVKLTATSLFFAFGLQVLQNSSEVTTTTSSARATTATTTGKVPLETLTWKSYSGSYYWFSAGLLEWINSRSECRKHNSDLVIINDKKELEFIHNKTEMGDYFIGLTLETTGNAQKWLWIDDTELKRTLFTMKPAQMGQECATIRGGEVSPALCHQQSHWICEKKIETK